MTALLEPSTGTSREYCIIGAGPSGLAAAAELKRRGRPYDHFESARCTGGIWDVERVDSPMYESAHFISSKTKSAFWGFPMPEDYPDYPGHRQILAYVRAYAEHHGLTQSICFGTPVERVVLDEESARVTVAGREQRYRGVVCASGVNWEPLIPEIPGEFSGEARHTRTYRDPLELRGKRVLIVGLGNSGADIACDAARSASKAVVSVRRGYHFIPKHVFGKPSDVFASEGPPLPVWLEKRVFGWLLRLILPRHRARFSRARHALGGGAQRPAPPPGNHERVIIGSRKSRRRPCRSRCTS